MATVNMNHLKLLTAIEEQENAAGATARAAEQARIFCYIAEQETNKKHPSSETTKDAIEKAQNALYSATAAAQDTKTYFTIISARTRNAADFDENTELWETEEKAHRIAQNAERQARNAREIFNKILFKTISAGLF